MRYATWHLWLCFPFRQAVPLYVAISHSHILSISNFLLCTRWLSKPKFLQSLSIVRLFVAFLLTPADAKRPLALEKFAYRNNEHAEDKLKETIRSGVSSVPRQALSQSFLQFIHQVSKVCGSWSGWFTTYDWIGHKYRVSQEERTKLREVVPYVKIYRYNPKHLYPKLNGYGDNGQRSLKLWQLLLTYWLPNSY